MMRRRGWSEDRKGVIVLKMYDTISRQAAIDAAMNDNLILLNMDSVKDGDIHRTKRAISRLLASLPPAQPEPKKGKWIRESFVTNYPYKCSTCKKYSRAMYDFCPCCGADMRDEKDGCGND